MPDATPCTYSDADEGRHLGFEGAQLLAAEQLHASRDAVARSEQFPPMSRGTHGPDPSCAPASASLTACVPLLPATRGIPSENGCGR